MNFKFNWAVGRLCLIAPLLRAKLPTSVVWQNDIKACLRLNLQTHPPDSAERLSLCPQPNGQPPDVWRLGAPAQRLAVPPLRRGGQRGDPERLRQGARDRQPSLRVQVGNIYIHISINIHMSIWIKYLLLSSFLFRTNGAVLDGFQKDVGRRTTHYTFSTNTFKNSMMSYRKQGYRGPPLSKVRTPAMPPPPPSHHHLHLHHHTTSTITPPPPSHHHHHHTTTTITLSVVPPDSHVDAGEGDLESAARVNNIFKVSISHPTIQASLPNPLL